MTLPNGRTVARAVMLGSLGLNAGIVVGHLVQGQYQPAALQSIAVVFLASWLYLNPKLDAWLDARLADAVTTQKMSAIALGEMERMQRAGELRVGMTVQGRHAERMH